MDLPRMWTALRADAQALGQASACPQLHKPQQQQKGFMGRNERKEPKIDRATMRQNP